MVVDHGRRFRLAEEAAMVESYWTAFDGLHEARIARVATYIRGTSYYRARLAVVAALCSICITC